MQQTSDTLFSPMSLIPNEILSMILYHTMRSDTPVHLEDFLRVGRRFQHRPRENHTKNIWQLSCPMMDLAWELRSLPWGSRAPTCVEQWFLDRLESGQEEHYRDWLLINSTCRIFRALGKKAFFSGKVFVVSPSFVRNICGETGKLMSPENMATARECIRHAIAPLAGVGIAGQFFALSRYHALQGLRSLSLLPHCSHNDIHSRLNAPTLGRYPLPKELTILLGGIGLRVDRLQMDWQYDNNSSEQQEQMASLTEQVYPYLQIMSARKARGKIPKSDDRNDRTITSLPPNIVSADDDKEISKI